MKRVRNDSNNNINRARKVSGREVTIDPIEIGRGMACPRTGIPRYLQIAKDRFDNQGIVSIFMDYTIQSGNYGMVKNIDKIVKGFGTPNVNSRINPTPQPHFIMVGMRANGGGHAVSVLVDPRPGSKHIWVFDPHGEASRGSVYGRTMREKVIPIIKNMWKIPTYRVRYYNGTNLQANNTRGTCSTFYVTFMDMIPYLLSGAANINQMNQLAGMNSTAVRQFFLNFPRISTSRIVARNVRL